MGTSTNTYTSVPTCENCGRDKQATYICDTCCDKLNAITRATREERDTLRAELASVKAESLRVVVDGEAYSMEDVDIWRCVDNMLGLYMYEKELLLCDDGTGLATPVRLERWGG